MQRAESTLGGQNLQSFHDALLHTDSRTAEECSYTHADTYNGRAKPLIKLGLSLLDQLCVGELLPEGPAAAPCGSNVVSSLDSCKMQNNVLATLQMA